MSALPMPRLARVVAIRDVRDDAPREGGAAID
jgi:hypothetical protein